MRDLPLRKLDRDYSIIPEHLISKINVEKIKDSHMTRGLSFLISSVSHLNLVGTHFCLQTTTFI